MLGKVLSLLVEPLSLLGELGVGGQRTVLSFLFGLLAGLLVLAFSAYRKKQWPVVVGALVVVVGLGLALLPVAGALNRSLLPVTAVAATLTSGAIVLCSMGSGLLVGALPIWVATKPWQRVLWLGLPIGVLVAVALWSRASTPSWSRISEVPEAGRTPADVQDMVAIPRGPFIRGSLHPAQLAKNVGNETGDESPPRTIYLDSYLIDRTEVTNEQFAAFVESTGYVTEVEALGTGNVWNEQGWRQVSDATWKRPIGSESTVAGLERHPVVQVSFRDATSFCEWAGKRLPTEAEWEKAARGIDARDYPWGHEFDRSRLNYCDRDCPIPRELRDVDYSDGYSYTAPVGSFPAGASPYGVMDMAGNVWEWVHDLYDPDYYQYSRDSNPKGPRYWFGWRGRGFRHRVVRGGSFAGESTYNRTTSRSYDPPENGYFGVGFRCAKDSAEP